MGGFEDLPIEPLSEGEGEKEGGKEGPVIKLPENPEMVERLRAKLEEYRRRLSDDQYKAPYAQQDTIYKIAILEKLLEDGVVDTWDLSRELGDKYGWFDVPAFESACGVIDNYAKNWGIGNIGGTGFKEGK